jgi:Spy/CpxP family protein refolding chaperone
MMVCSAIAPAGGRAQAGTTDYTELQAYLQLTGDQLQALRQIERQQDADLQPMYQLIYDKMAQVTALLGSGSGDATQIGQLEIDIVHLRGQLSVAGRPYRQQSFAVLTADQQLKLPVLVQSLILTNMASKAVTLHLIDNPNLPGAVTP